APGTLAPAAYAGGSQGSESGETWEHEWLEHIWRYQGLVLDMDPSTCNRLAARLHDVFIPFDDS
ncbi:MAG: hypothetical protein ACOC9X_03815, partial [bacterium]